MQNNRWLFLLLVLSVIVSYLSSLFLDLDVLISTSLSSQFTQSQIDEYLTFKNKWELLSYLVIPILLFLKVLVIAAILDLGCFLYEYKIKYKKLFNLVIKAEFLFLGVIILKTVWFYFFQTNYTLEDLQYFYPFSLLNIIDYEDLEPWFVYLLQVINLFEVVYWVLLAYLLDKELRTPKGEHTGIKIVASTYGVGLLIWVVAIMFFTLNMS